MKSKNLLKLFGAIVLAAVVAMAFVPGCAKEAPAPAPAPAPEEETFHWSWTVPFPAGDHSADIEVPWVIDMIEKATNGRWTADRYYSCELVPDEDTLVGVGQGIAEMGTGSMSYFSGVEPALGVGALGLPFTLRSPPGDAYAFDNSGPYSELVREILAELNCHYVGSKTNGPWPMFCSTVPIRKAEDWKGVKVRMVGNSADLLNELGAATCYIPGGEEYEALMLGTIDVATWSSECIEDMHFKDVMDYLILPPLLEWHMDATFINQEAWDSLPVDIQEAIHKANRVWHLANAESYSAKMKRNVEMADEWGYEVITLPPEEVDKMIKVAEEVVWAEFAKKSPRCAQAIEMVTDWYAPKW